MNEDTYRDKLNDLQLEVEALRAKLTKSQTGDLISRAAALTALTSTAGVGNRALDKIRSLPSAQPEIIRCKDCVNWDTTWTNDWAPNYYYCPIIDGVKKYDFYCADAERRTDETP